VTRAQWLLVGAIGAILALLGRLGPFGSPVIDAALSSIGLLGGLVSAAVTLREWRREVARAAAEWLPFTAEQRHLLTRALAGTPGTARVVYVKGDVRRAFAENFRDALRDAGWSAETDSFVDDQQPTRVGLRIVAQTPLPAWAPTLRRAMSEMGFDVKTIEDNDNDIKIPRIVVGCTPR
jgi:hypothetical protein